MTYIYILVHVVDTNCGPQNPKIIIIIIIIIATIYNSTGPISRRHSVNCNLVLFNKLHKALKIPFVI